MRVFLELLSLLVTVSSCSAHRNASSAPVITNLPQCAVSPFLLQFSRVLIQRPDSPQNNWRSQVLAEGFGHGDTYRRRLIVTMLAHGLTRFQLDCLVSVVGDSACSAPNQTCLCIDNVVLGETESCVFAACTPVQALYSQNLTQTLCNAPIRDRSGEYEIINKTLGTVTGICVLVRILSQLIFSRDVRLRLDDWFVLVTFLIGLPAAVISVHGLTAHGLGRDVWTLSPEDIIEFTRYFYVLEALYLAQVATLKLGMLFFYLRIFPGLTVRRLLWATVAVDACYGSAFVLVAIWQCIPISYYWNHWRDIDAQGRCVNINAIGWSNSAISIALDLWMLAIPLIQLNHLKLHWKKKASVAFMFIAGTFVTVMSILRLHSLILFANSNNSTWDQLEITNWSAVEVNSGIICTCMPNIRMVLVRLWRLVFGGKADAALDSSRGRPEPYIRNRGHLDTVLSNSGRSSLQLQPPAMVLTATDRDASTASLSCVGPNKENYSKKDGILAVGKDMTCTRPVATDGGYDLSGYSGSTYSDNTQLMDLQDRESESAKSW